MKIIDCKLNKNTWTNGLYELEVIVDKWRSIPTEIIDKTERCTFIYGERDSFVSYGCVDEKGYIWSSRASVFNGMFNKKCMEIVVNDNGNKIASNMLVDEVLNLIPSDFYIIEQTETDENGNVMEINYYISNAKHEESEKWYFRDIEYDSGAKRYISNRLS